MNKYTTKGKHIIVDAYGIDPFLLDNIHYLHNLGKFAIAKSGAVFVDMIAKKFEPYGCTLLFLLEESHLSFHTFIQNVNDSNSFLAIDMYTCGDANPNKAIDYILSELKPDRVEREILIRGEYKESEDYYQ